MCELLGISSDTPDDYKDILRNFFEHSLDNPHGWGMMVQKNESESGRHILCNKTEVVKEPVSAIDSVRLDKIIHDMGRQKIILAHIRYATVGTVKYENCHPYTGTDCSGREWTMIHNGTIYSGNAISKFSSVQKGDTDSERIFLYVLSEINRAIKQSTGNLTARQRFDVIEGLINGLSQRNKLNIMLFDGELLYVHKNMKNTLSFKRQKNGIILATKPLDDEGWIPLLMTRLLAFKDGRLVYEGADHGNVFVPALETITQYDAMNI